MQLTKLSGLEYLDIIQPKFLSKDFLAKYANTKPPFTTDLGLVVLIRTYCRFIPDLKRRERWWEMLARVVDHNISLYKGPASHEALCKEAQELYDYAFNMKVFVAGRSMWVGGTDVVKKFGESMFNCSFRAIDSIEAYPEIFYLLMVGAGAGFSVEEKYISKLPKFNYEFAIEHKPYEAVPKQMRIEYTEVSVSADYFGMFSPMQPKTLILDKDYLVDENSTAVEDSICEVEGKSVKLVIKVGDSKEGWAGALKAFLHALSCPKKITSIVFNYNFVRPEGERLLTMGGRSSGPGPLRKLFEKITWTLRKCKGVVGSVEAMDFGNFIAEITVVGGVRRSSEVTLGDKDDIRFIESKVNLFSGPNLDTNQLNILVDTLLDCGKAVNLEVLNSNLAEEKRKSPWLVGVPLDLVFNQFGGNHSFLWSGKYPEIEAFVDSFDPKYRYRSSRTMSNNSIHLYEKPGKEELTEIFKRTENNGEPGLVIAGNALKRRADYQGVNPCISGSSWVHTEFGARRVKDILGIQTGMYIDGELFSTTERGFFQTGVKEVYTLKTKEGYSLEPTDNHQILKVISLTPKREQTDWVELKDLRPGDKVKINNHRGITPWHGEGSFDEGWLLGNLVGNGCMVKGPQVDKGVLRYWGGIQEAVGERALEMVNSNTNIPRGPLSLVKHKRNGYSQICSVGLGALAEKYAIKHGNKTITDQVEMASYEFYKGFLQGLFDADGTVGGSQEKGVSVRLSQASLPILYAVQRMLLRLGIASSVYTDRRAAGVRKMPDGKGGLAPYSCQAVHELVITNDNISVYRELIGFSHSEKSRKLDEALQNYKRNLNRERFVVTVDSIELKGVEPVYDCTVPQVSRFDANGLVVHNCVEILLTNRGVCNLSEVNVNAFVKGKADFDFDDFIKAVRLASRVGSRVTNSAMWHPEWDQVQKRDRLLGVSLTGQVEAWDALGYGYTLDENGNYRYVQQDIISSILKLGHNTARQEADKYHNEMGIPRSLLVTCVKPSGTISQLPTVSSGGHRAYAPYYLRRVRIAKADPVAKALRQLGVPCVPENDQGSDLDADQCTTWVFTFPVKTNAPIRAIDEPAVAQLQRYKDLMDNYVEHNASITVTVRGPSYDENGPIPGTSEWPEVVDWLSIQENWDSVVGVSFLPRWDPTEGESMYPNLPYQPSTEEECLELSKQFKIDEQKLVDLISLYEQEYEEMTLDPDCSSGACPVR